MNKERVGFKTKIRISTSQEKFIKYRALQLTSFSAAFIVFIMKQGIEVGQGRIFCSKTRLWRFTEKEFVTVLR